MKYCISFVFNICSRELQHGFLDPEIETVVRQFDTDTEALIRDPSDQTKHHSLIDAPVVQPGDAWGQVGLLIHYTLYPLKFMLHHSLPDVSGKDGRKKYVSCIFVAVVWLAILSFIMIQCCDELGKFIGASPVVMGLTLSAVGTSFPNMWR